MRRRRRRETMMIGKEIPASWSPLASGQTGPEREGRTTICLHFLHKPRKPPSPHYILDPLSAPSTLLVHFYTALFTQEEDTRVWLRNRLLVRVPAPGTRIPSPVPEGPVSLPPFAPVPGWAGWVECASRTLLGAASHCKKLHSLSCTCNSKGDKLGQVPKWSWHYMLCSPFNFRNIDVYYLKTSHFTLSASLLSMWPSHRSQNNCILCAFPGALVPLILRSFQVW